MAECIPPWPLISRRKLAFPWCCLHTSSQMVGVLRSTTRPVAPSNSTAESLCAQATLAPQTSLTCAPLSAGRAPVSFADGDVPRPSRRVEVDLSSVAPSNSTEGRGSVRRRPSASAPLHSDLDCVELRCSTSRLGSALALRASALPFRCHPRGLCPRVCPWLRLSPLRKLRRCALALRASALPFRCHPRGLCPRSGVSLALPLAAPPTGPLCPAPGHAHLRPCRGRH